MTKISYADLGNFVSIQYSTLSVNSINEYGFIVFMISVFGVALYCFYYNQHIVFMLMQPCVVLLPSQISPKRQ